MAVRTWATSVSVTSEVGYEANITVDSNGEDNVTLCSTRTQRVTTLSATS